MQPNVLKNTLGTPTNVDKATFSTWIKFSDVTSSNDTAIFSATADGNNTTHLEKLGSQVFRLNMRESSSYIGVLTTNRVFRDPSAWMHIVVAFDTTQGTASNRIKLYINGVQETSFSTATYPTQKVDLRINTSGQVFNIGSRGDTGNHPDAYYAETVFIDGQQLDPTSFGEFDADTGIWKPIDVSGLTFGTNGFYLDFENSGSLGADVSGNGNNFTVNNLTAIDQSTDTCTNNYCTLNPLSKGTITLAEGNLQWQGSGDNGGKGTFLMTKGKWYWEMKRADSQDNVGLGVAISNWTNSVNSASGEAWYGYQGQAYKVSGTGGEVSYGTSFSNNDIVSVLFDADNGNLAFYVNGSSQGTAFTGLTDSEGYVPIYFTYRTSVTNYMNFGSPMHSISSGNSDADGYGNFEYAVPSGYYALNTKNLAEYG